MTDIVLAASNITLYIVLANERYTHLWTTDRRLVSADTSVVAFDRVPEAS